MTPDAARREVKVLASEHRLRAALEALPDFFAIYAPQRDASGRVVDLIYEYANPAALEVLHRPAHEVLGRGLVEIMPSNVELGLLDRYVRVLETAETDRFELPWFDEAGVAGAFLITVAPMDDRLLIMARDVTEARRAQPEAAAPSEPRFRAALDAMLDSVVIASAVRDDTGLVDFLIDYINPNSEIGGRSQEELTGKRFTEAWPSSRDGPSPTFDLYRQLVETGEPVIRDALHYVDVIDGRSVEGWFDLRATKLGEGFVQAFRDVTARVLDLQALTERAAALERSNADLQEFVYAAGHDLAAPMRTARGFAQVLDQRLADIGDPDVLEAVGSIGSSVDRSLQMLRSLLTYSRVQTEAAPAMRVHVAEVLDDVRENLRGQLESAGARLEATALPTVKGDRTQLLQLLQNLVANAVTYVDPAVTPVVRVAAQRTRDGWQVTVTDNGVGIPAHEREGAFRLFARAASAGTHSGNGVGLALCRRIVIRHGGQIWLEDGPRGGTRVTFTLPDSPTRAPARAPARA